MKTSNQQKTHIKTPRVFLPRKVYPPLGVFKKNPKLPRTSGVTSAATAAASPPKGNPIDESSLANETLDADVRYDWSILEARKYMKIYHPKAPSEKKTSAAFLKKAAFRDAWRKFWFYHTQQLPVGLAQKVFFKTNGSSIFLVRPWTLGSRQGAVTSLLWQNLEPWNPCGYCLYSVQSFPVEAVFLAAQGGHPARPGKASHLLMPAGSQWRVVNLMAFPRPARPIYEDWLFRCTARTWILVGSKYIHLSSWNVSRSSRPPLNQQRVDEFSNPHAQQPFCQTKNVTSDITSYFSEKYMGVISKFAASALTVII